MAVPDPSLGILANIDAVAVRNALRFAMQFGAPPEDARKATFVFPSSGKTYTKGLVTVTNPRLDRDGVPLDPEIKVTKATPTEVQVDCAVEVNDVRPEELPVGKYRATKATVTVLDEQYALIKGCKEMRFNGDRYAYDSEQYGLGLAQIGVYVMHFFGIDES